MKSYPVNGRFGEFGGQFVPETLVPALQELESAYLRWKSDAGFRAELDGMLREYAGRPTPLYFARNLTKRAGGAMIFLKREDLLHGGAHKINNTLGQGLLAKRMGKQRVIAETGAGQHGCGHGHRLRRPWAEGRSLHGFGGHRAAEAERLQDG